MLRYMNKSVTRIKIRFFRSRHFAIRVRWNPLSAWTTYLAVGKQPNGFLPLRLGGSNRHRTRVLTNHCNSIGHLMKPSLFLSCLVVVSTSCSFLHSETKRTVDARGMITETTSARAFTFFDANASLTKFRNQSSSSSTNQWAAGTYISGLNESSSTTNLTSIISAVATGVVQGLK